VIISYSTSAVNGSSGSEKRADKKHAIQDRGTQGSRRPPDEWPSRPLHFPDPPFIPPRTKALSHHIFYSTTITKNTAELERLEGAIQNDIGSFYELGHALAEIRGQGYYRDVLGFETFEQSL
jgi:hypothetical protein